MSRKALLISIFILTSLISFGQSYLSGTYKGRIILKEHPLQQKEIDLKGGAFMICYFDENYKAEISAEWFGIPAKGETTTYKIENNKVYINTKKKPTIFTIRKDGKLIGEDSKVRLLMVKVDD